MHSFTTKNGTYFHYNSDMSGDVIINRQVSNADGQIATESVEVPGEDILDFAADIIRHRMVCRIEDMTTEEILRGDL